jgi:hypothetical protein
MWRSLAKLLRFTDGVQLRYTLRYYQSLLLSYVLDGCIVHHHCIQNLSSIFKRFCKSIKLPKMKKIIPIVRQHLGMLSCGVLTRRACQKFISEPSIRRASWPACYHDLLLTSVLLVHLVNCLTNAERTSSMVWPDWRPSNVSTMPTDRTNG